MSLEDITPDDSVAPVFLDTTPPVEVGDVVDINALIAATQASKQAAAAKLRTLGLTDDEVAAILGG